MKKLFFLLTVLPVLVLLHSEAIAQDNLKIKDANGNTLLEAREAGILLRKMTTVERTAVAGLDSNDNGLMVYDTDMKSLWIWHDMGWVEIDGIDLVNDADSDPTNELQTWITLPGIPAGFEDGIDDVNDADNDPTNELQTWTTLPGIPAGFGDNIDDVNDADSDPTNELQTWTTLPGIPAGFGDNTDDVNDADSDPLNEKNNSLQRNGTNLEISDAGGTLVANIGWAVDAGKVFNSTDNIGIGTNTTPARLTVQEGAVLFNGTTGGVPVSGAGTRLMWVPSKHAFRAGVVTSTQWDNTNIGQRSFVAGGTDNLASGWNSIVAGGGESSAIADGSFVGGGFDNTATGINSFVAGGFSNTSAANESFVGAGVNNTASGIHSFVGGGENNIASAWNSVVAGGVLGSAVADGDFVGGGYDNTASGGNSFVGGGVQNSASGGNSFAAAGLSNTASGYAAFVTGRENIASGNHSFAAGHGLLAKSLDEVVFGSYNTDYSPATPLGYDNADRLFVIGNGYDSGSRSNAMTILKGGQVGIGTDAPSAGLHVKGSKGPGEFIMLIENSNHEGSGLKIRINGSHPMWVQGEGENPDFFITRPVSAMQTIFEDVGGDIRDYLLSENGLSLSELNISQIGSPAGLIDQLGLTEFLSGGLCKGISNLVDFTNSTLLHPIELPDLPLDGIPHDIPDIPVNLPTLSFSNLPWDPADPCLTVGTWDFCVPLNFTLPLSNLNSSSAITNFNNAINAVNTGTGTVNTVLENGYDKVKDAILSLDNLAIPLPQLQMPESIGFVDCPNPNPWDNFDINFQRLNPADYNILNPLSNDNSFITFVDNYDNRLGAITAQSIGEFNLDYFKLEKVIEIGSYIVGILSVDGSMFKNVMKLGKEALSYYKASDKIGVEYSSGHGDYAEWLEREDHEEVIGYGEIVGIRGGKVSRSLESAEQVMVVSKAPIVRGNIPAPEHEKNGNNIAFIGQVPVRVMGPVNTGDYIVANQSTPGYGIAVPADEITPEQFAFAVGKSWETNSTPGFKFVNTIVGMHNNAWTLPMMKMQQRLEVQEASIQSLADRMDKMEYGSSLVADGKRKKH